MLPPPAQAQEPFLHEYRERYARVIDLRDGRPPPFPLEDLCLLYDEVRNRTARLLGTDKASEQRIKDKVKELYDVRSDIVHNRLHRLTPERVHSAFVEGFDLTRQSLFRLLREGSPQNWDAASAGAERQGGGTATGCFPCGPPPRF